jgi:hypothetical protein
MAVKFSNNAKTTLASAVSSSATSISVSDASAFPTLAAGDHTYATLVQVASLTTLEIVKVTAISGTTLTVVRAQQGTSAISFSAADLCELRVTSGLVQDALDEKVDDSQVLTNVPSGAVFTDTNTVYSHPSFSTTNIDTSGATIVDYITTTSEGHISAMGTRTLTAENLGALKDTDDTFTGTLTVAGDLETTGGTSSIFNCPVGAEGHSSNTWPIQVYQATVNKDAMISFHVSGDYAFQFGLDGSSNKLSVGGWSMGANMYEIYHSGNKGDANTLGGRAFTDASTGSTIVGRNSSGDIKARLFRSEYDSTNATIGYIMTQVDTVSNNYIRPSTPTQLVDGCNLIDNRTTQPHSLTIRNGSPTFNFRDTDHRGFHLHCNSNLLYMLNSNAVDGTSWATVNGHWAFHINSTNNAANFGGSITAIGNITAYSDERIKDNIETIDSALEKVTQMRGVFYNRNDLGEEENAVRRTGVVAQEVEKILPEVVRENEEKDVDDSGNTLEGGRKRLTVDYGNMVGILIEAIKEQQEQIDSLKKELQEIKR